MEKISIATAADSLYFPALMALLRSLKRTNPGIPVTVLDGGLTPFQARRARAFAEVVPRRPFTSIAGRGKFSYVSDASLLKFEAAAIPYDKVLFLDADTVVLEDLEPLFSFPEGTVGVVPEVNAVKNMFRPRDREVLREAVDIDWEKNGFNAGIFALRPAEWPRLKEDGLGLIFRFGAEVFSKTKDQQLLNIIFSGKTYFLPRRYNFSPLYDEGKGVDPAVIHYLTGCKPWHRDYPRGCRYREFRKNLSILDHPPILGIDILKCMTRRGTVKPVRDTP